MPVYDYKCKDHGVFDALATMAQSSDPAQCPQCNELCSRVIILPPEMFKMDKAKKQGHETNERNQHEPTYSSKERRQDDDKHSKGCGCENKIGKSAMLLNASGEKFFPSMRPWMISH